MGRTYRVVGTYYYTMEYEESVDRTIRASDEFGIVELADTQMGGYSRFEGEAVDVTDEEGESY